MCECVNKLEHYARFNYTINFYYLSPYGFFDLTDRTKCVYSKVHLKCRAKNEIKYISLFIFIVKN